MPEVLSSLAECLGVERDQLQRLRAEDAELGRLMEEYAALDRRIVRCEAGIEAESELRLEAMRRARLTLLDAIGLAAGGRLRRLPAGD